MQDNMSAENEDFYDEDEEVVEEDLDQDQEDNLEDDYMEIDLDQKPDVKSLKVPPGPPSSTYSPSEENILIKLKLGNCTMEEVERYKEELQHEQWTQSEDLPTGWMYKQFGSDMKLLGRGGELFEDMNEAFEFVEKYQAYFSREDIMKIFAFGEDKPFPNKDTNVEDFEKDIKMEENIADDKPFPNEYNKVEDFDEDIKIEENIDKPFLNENTKVEAFEEDIKMEENINMEDAEEATNLRVWVSDDPSVPKGWKIRKSKFGWNVIQSQVMSPDNKHFSGRRVALKFMIENNFLEDEIDAMRKCLKHDGWLKDQALPVNWFYKPDHKGTNYFLDDKANFYRYNLEVFKKNNDMKVVDSLKSFLNAQKRIYKHGKDLDGDWCHDDTVPEGWMIRKVGGANFKNSYHLLSPEKQHFTARRNALKFMIEKNYPEDDVESMRKCMKYDGWQESPYLPLNWFYKSDRENHDGTNSFLDAAGNFYKSQIKVLKSYNTKEVLDAMKAFMDNSKRSYNIKEDSAGSWSSNDSSVPKGWMVRQVRSANVKNSYHLLSPERQHFPGRRQALKYLINKGYPEGDIEEMRKCLKHDGWLEDPRLPLKWFYKSRNEAGRQYLDARGNFFDSKDAVLRVYSEDETVVGSIKHFLENQTPTYMKGKNIDPSWIFDDPRAPRGWGIREKTNGNTKICQLLSPERRFFESLRVALKYLIDNHQPEEDIEEMRNCLKQEGWLEETKLPLNWLVRLRSEGGNHYIDAKGNFFSSKDAAIRSYSHEKDIVDAIKDFLGSVTPVYKKGKEIDPSWIFEDPRAPKGWAIRERNNGSTTKKIYQLLSPERRFFDSFKTALTYLIESQQPEENIEEMRKLMENDGWYRNSSLPESWLFKFQGRPDSQSYFFISAEGQFFRCKEAALKYLNENNLTDEKEKVAAFSLRPENKPKRTLDEGYKKDDPTVPTGWLVKNVKFGHSNTSSLLFSPEGDTFQGRRPALKFMIEKNYPEEKIEEMRELMKFEGYYFDARLPEKWLYKSTAKHSSFVDPSGNYYRSKFDAIKMLKTKGQSQNLNILLGFSEKKQEINEYSLTEKSTDHTWLKDDPSVPTGWMMKVVKFGGVNVTKLVSPRGQPIQGRRLALKMMIAENFSKEDVSEMRACLKYDGWSWHESLPKDWLYKTSRDGTAFIDANGDLFRKKGHALRHLQEKGTVECMESFKILKAFQSDESSSPAKKSSPTKKSPKRKSILNEDWKEFDSEHLSGWRYKEDSAGHKRYLSPSGFYLNSRSHVMKFLLENKYSKDAMIAMRSTFKTDGWQMDSKLPESWLWKRSTNQMMFLSPKGALFKSKVEAVNHMKSHEDSPSDIELMSNFMRGPGK